MLTVIIRIVLASYSNYASYAFADNAFVCLVLEVTLEKNIYSQLRGLLTGYFLITD